MGHYKTIKKCIICSKEFLPTSGKQWFCSKKCRTKNNNKKWAARRAKWAENNPDKIKITQIRSRLKLKNNPQKHKEHYRKSNLKSYYGMSIEEYNKLFIEQNGLCAICGQSETRKINGNIVSLSVDHNHTTGKIRKLLCSSCNFKISIIEDKEFLEKGLKYLKEN